MNRTRAPYESTKTVLDFSSPLEYVKKVLDSKAPPYKGGYETEGYSLLPARYSNLKDEKQKKLISNAIVELLDDPDYSCDAIPVAAELGLPEAKDWFLNLSKKPIEEIRKVKTNNYTNGLSCLLMYSSNHIVFLNCLKDLLNVETLTYSERLSIINKMAIHEPHFVIQNCGLLLEEVLKNWVGREIDKDLIIFRSVCEAIEKVGYEQCIYAAKRMKELASRDLQLLYYDSITKLPKYKPYLEDLKKILEINELSETK